MADEAVVTTLEEIFQNAPYSNYERLRIDLENVNKQNLEKEQKFDITHASPLAASRKRDSESKNLIIAKDDEAYGVILRIENNNNDAFPNIYIDVPITKNVKPVQHTDFFFNNSFDPKEFDHIIFKPDNWFNTEYDKPIINGIARIKLDPNFPESIRYNKFLGMVSSKRVYDYSKEVAKIKSEGNISGASSSTEEARLEARKSQIFTEDDVKSVTSLYNALTMGQGKSFNNKKILSIKKRAVEDFIELNKAFRLQVASLFNLAWENGIQITTLSTLSTPEDTANLYIYGRFCEETKEKKYIEIMKLPYYNPSDIGCSIHLVGLDLFTLKTVDKKKFPYNSLYNLSFEKGVGLMPPNEKEPTLWSLDEENLQIVQTEFFKQQKISETDITNLIQGYLTNAIGAAVSEGAKLIKKPNISAGDSVIMGGIAWYDYLRRTLTE